jgi:hypothetical protein
MFTIFTRFLCCLSIVAAFSVTAVFAQATNPCDCCAKKPHYDPSPVSAPFPWALFTGQVAIVTQQRPGDPGPLPNQVLVIWNLTNQAGAPRNTWWNPSTSPPTQYYSDPRWNSTDLGDVFGLTIDNNGNIYMAASTSYGSGNVGALSTGGTNLQKAGQVYKIANGTGTPAPFCLLPNDGNGLGNIYYDCGRDSLYASDFYDGLVYRVDATTRVVQLPAWDHGNNLATAVDAAGVPLGRSAIPPTAKDGSSSYTALGRRVWAVLVYKNRLWYSVWNDNQGRNTGNPNEIWSAALDVHGDPMPPARLEITLPLYSSTPKFTNPVSDMSFGPMGTLMVAERTMTNNGTPGAHFARALEYSYNGSAWVLPNPTAYKVGTFFNRTNSAGGVGFDFGPGGLAWVSADAMHLSTPDNIYGIQGFPQGGGDITNSVLIDDDDYVVQQNKTQIGDVKIPCPDCSNPPMPPVISGPQATCSSPSHYTIIPQAGVTYTWTVSGGSPSTATGSAIDVNWSGTGPSSITVTTSGPPGCGVVQTTISVSPCDNCAFCREFKTDVVLKSPIALGGGLESVTPTITSNMPGVTSVTVTLLSASVAYSLRSCGVAGPLGAYIPLASASSVAALNPPLLPVPNGNQAIWHASSAVNLSGGATTPFQLQLPPPPSFTNPDCRASFSFCLRVSLKDAECKNCDVLRCFGPFPYATPFSPEGGIGPNLPAVVPFILPGTLTLGAPNGSFLVPLLTFIQDAGNTTVPQRFVIDGLSFEPGNASVPENFIPVLNDLGTVLKAYPSIQIRVEGFADNSGGAPSSQRLSLERAQAVQILLLRAGVAANQVTVEGPGSANPIGSNNTEGSRGGNNRIELVVLHK